MQVVGWDVNNLPDPGPGFGIQEIVFWLRGELTFAGAGCPFWMAKISGHLGVGWSVSQTAVGCRLLDGNVRVLDWLLSWAALSKICFDLKSGFLSNM